MLGSQRLTLLDSKMILWNDPKISCLQDPVGHTQTSHPQHPTTTVQHNSPTQPQFSRHWSELLADMSWTCSTSFLPHRSSSIFVPAPLPSPRTPPYPKRQTDARLRSVTILMKICSESDNYILHLVLLFVTFQELHTGARYQRCQEDNAVSGLRNCMILHTP